MGIGPQGLSASMMTCTERRELKEEEKKKQKFIAYKLGRKADPKNPHPPMVPDGSLFDSPATASVFDWEEQVGIKADVFVPQIGKCVLIKARGFYDYVRTSLIEDFYIHGDTENSKDKIVIKPENMHLLEGIKFEDGDTLLITMNSLYFLKVA